MMGRRLGMSDVGSGEQVAVYLNYHESPHYWVAGEVIGYSDSPMVLIRQADGSQHWVSASLRWEPLTEALRNSTHG